MLLVTSDRYECKNSICAVPVKPTECDVEPLYTAYYFETSPTHTIFTKHTLTKTSKSVNNGYPWKITETNNPYQWNEQSVSFAYSRVIHFLLFMYRLNAIDFVI